MLTDVDICNRALSAIGTRSTITSLSENSPEAIACNTLYASTRDEVLRMAPWNSATNWDTLELISSAPGTPENPGVGSATWEKGLPPPPWAYQYEYPANCIRPLWIVPQFSTGFVSGIPITTAVTSGAPQWWNGPPVRFKVGIDQRSGPVPPGQTLDRRVILTNQQDAILCYLKRVTEPDVWDEGLQNAITFTLASRLVWQLTGMIQQANMKVQEANQAIQTARAMDGNEGLTINDQTPDWIRTRGILYPPGDFSWTPNQFDWGPLLTMY